MRYLCLLLLVACSQTRDEDVFGGGNFEVTFGPGDMAGSYEAAGASQQCLDKHHKTWCNEPMATLSNHSEEDDELDMFSVHAYLPVASSDPRPECFGGAELELVVYVTQHMDESDHDVWFELHDPELTAADPNADQGGPTSPQIRGSAHIEEKLEPASSGSVSATFELSARNGCELEESATMDMTVSWDFDPSVTAGEGLFDLE